MYADPAHGESISEAHKQNGYKPINHFKKGHRHSEATKEKMKGPRPNAVPWNKQERVSATCLECKGIYLTRPYLLENKNKKFCSRKCFAKNSDHGKTDEAKKIRMSRPYKAWREAVFARDNFTCQDCGVRGGVELNADHIFPFAHFPEQRLLVENGRTLCHDCHKKTASYGSKGQKYSEFDFCPTYLLTVGTEA